MSYVAAYWQVSSFGSPYLLYISLTVYPYLVCIYILFLVAWIDAHITGIKNYKDLVSNNNINSVVISTKKSGENIQVDNGDTNYHIVEIEPTNRNLLNTYTVLGAQMNNLKFDVSHINQS